MSPQELRDEAERASTEGSGCMTLCLPRSFKRPAGFPRGELLSDVGDRVFKVWSFDAAKVLAWVNKNATELGL